MPAVPGDVCLRSAVTADGIDAFHLTGLIADRLATARWDGAVLTVSPGLYQRAALAVAIDSLVPSSPDGFPSSVDGLTPSLDGFASSPSRPEGGGPARWRFALAGPATGVILTLASSCDVVEFRRGGRRRAVVAVAGGSTSTMDLGGGGPAVTMNPVNADPAA